MKSMYMSACHTICCLANFPPFMLPGSLADDALVAVRLFHTISFPIEIGQLVLFWSAVDFIDGVVVKW